jgi:dolichol-phosphate mannosyltransferase
MKPLRNILPQPAKNEVLRHHRGSESSMSEADTTPRVLVITPTYNERENLGEFVSQLFAATPQVSLLIVDDNSPDGTGQLADELHEKDPRISVLHRSGKLGLGTAYIDGFHLGLEQGFERFVEMDADMSHDPKYLGPMLALMDQGADVVVGSRNIKGGSVDGWGLGRHVLSKGGSLYARLVLGVGVHDLTTGYKVFSAQVLRNLALEKVHSNGYSFQIEMTYRASLRGYRIVEYPIVFKDRAVGSSKMNRRIVMEAMWVAWQLRYEALRGRL